MRGLSLFAFNFAIPVMLLRTLAQTELPPQPEWSFVLAYFSGAFAVFALGALAARPAFGRRGAEPAIFGISAAFSNTIILGIPIVLRAFGDVGRGAAVADPGLPQRPAVHPDHDRRPRSGPGLAHRSAQVLRNVGSGLIGNPILWGISGGLALNFLGLALPPVLDQLAATLGSAALPTALFALGANLSRFRLTRTLREALLLTVLKIAGAAGADLAARQPRVRLVARLAGGRGDASRRCPPASTPTCSPPATMPPSRRPRAPSWSRPWSRW